MRARLCLEGALLLLILTLLLLGCHHEEPPPPVPPAPEDLSTWSVPELVQPPLPETPPAQSPPQEKPTSAEQVLAFIPSTMFTLTVPVGAPLDIVLQRGEQVRNIIGGDRAPVEANQTTRWEIKEGADGIGESLRQHIFLTATTPGLTTGLIVTTTARTYYLTCKSVGKSPIRTVRWRYLVDTGVVKPVKEPGLLPDPTQPMHWHTGYVLTSARATAPDWLPRFVLDDGKKMYLIFPEVTLFATTPMVRKIGPNGAALINARTFLNVLMVDELAGRLELRVGIGDTAEVVTITRGALRTIACPGDASCPVWPAAAQVLAQRSPPVQPPPTAGGTGTITRSGSLRAPATYEQTHPRTHIPAPVPPAPPVPPLPEGTQP
jgi:type IV secretory pathway VirB9-like protein